MKTQDKKLAFTKNAVTELNNDQLIQVKGGTSPLLPSIVWLTPQIIKEN